MIDAIKRQITRNVPRASDVATHQRSSDNSQHTTNDEPERAATDFDETQYADFRPMPGSRTKKQIYYGAPVQSTHWTAQEYHDRFEYVAEELAGKVSSHKDLNDSFRDIGFNLWMVGTTPQAAIPSIVIFCKSKHVGPLKELFDPARHKLYCAKDSKAYQLFKKTPLSEPPFKLEYYRTDKAVDRRAAWEIVSAGIRLNGELCGTPVHYGNARANIGITLRVDVKTLSTTVDHLFGARSNSCSSEVSDDDTVSVYSDGSNQRTLNEDDLISLDPLWKDDPEDADLEDLDLPRPIGHGIDRKLNSMSTKPPDRTKMIQGHKVDGLLDLPTSSCFRDVALLQLQSRAPYDLQPNSFVLPDSDQRHIIRGIAETPRFHGVPVYILLGERGVRTGRLLSGFAHIGSGPSQAMCKAWTLIFDGTDSKSLSHSDI